MHAGVVVGRLGSGGIGRSILPTREYASQQQQSGKDEERSDHVRIKAWKAGSMWTRASTLVLAPGRARTPSLHLGSKSGKRLPKWVSRARNAGYNRGFACLRSTE